jgi:hypothetical protein
VDRLRMCVLPRRCGARPTPYRKCRAGIVRRCRPKCGLDHDSRSRV